MAGWQAVLKRKLKAIAPFVAPVVAVVAPQLLPAIGSALGATSAAAAAAVGGAVVSGSTAVLSGADLGDALKAAAGGGAGGYFGNLAGGAAKAAGAGTIGTAAAEGGTASATKALVQTGDVGKALEAGAKGAAVSGGVQAGVEGVKGAIESQPQAKLKAPAEMLYQSGALGEKAPLPSVGLTERVPTGGGVGLVADPSLLYSSRFAPSQPMREKEGGGVQPAYQKGQSLITPESLSAYSEPYKGQKTYTTPTLTRSEEAVLRDALQLGIENVLTRQPTQMAGGGTRQVGPVDTTATPGSQALAQALRVGDLGAPIFGRDEGEGRRGGWNVASLRYMGNSEA